MLTVLNVGIWTWERLHLLLAKQATEFTLIQTVRLGFITISPASSRQLTTTEVRLTLD